MPQLTRVAIAVAALVAASPASAATVTLDVERVLPPKNRSFDVYKISYAAATGEANSVELAEDRVFRRVLLRDRTAPVTAGEGCAQVDAQAVSCPTGGERDGWGVVIALGDGQDSASVGPVIGGVEVDGGPGDDVLAGGTRPEDGIAQGDRLSGGDGDDAIAGNGDDDLLDGGLGSDVLDGGPGTDRLSFAIRTSPVTVDLARGAAGGAPGEADRLQAIEEVVGGAGADTIDGDAARNHLLGGGGEDVVRGGDGDDHLDGRSGADRLEGGDGDDQIDDLGAEGRSDDVLLGGDGDDRLNGYAGADSYEGGPGRDRIDSNFPDRAPRTVACGGGRDVVGVNRFTTVRRDCEWISTNGVEFRPPYPYRTGRRAVRMRLRCMRRSRRTPPCRHRLDLRESGRTGSPVLGSARFAMRAGRVVELIVPLTARGRARIRGLDRLVVRMTERSERRRVRGYAVTGRARGRR